MLIAVLYFIFVKVPQRNWLGWLSTDCMYRQQIKYLLITSLDLSATQSTSNEMQPRMQHCFYFTYYKKWRLNLFICSKYSALYLGDSEKKYTQLANLTLLLPLMGLYGLWIKWLWIHLVLHDQIDSSKQGIYWLEITKHPKRLESTSGWPGHLQDQSFNNYLCIYRPNSTENYLSELIALAPSELKSVTHSSPWASLLNLYSSLLICTSTLTDFVHMCMPNCWEKSDQQKNGEWVHCYMYVPLSNIVSKLMYLTIIMICILFMISTIGRHNSCILQI